MVATPAAGFVSDLRHRSVLDRPLNRGSQGDAWRPFRRGRAPRVTDSPGRDGDALEGGQRSRLRQALVR